MVHQHHYNSYVDVNLDFSVKICFKKLFCIILYSLITLIIYFLWTTLFYSFKYFHQTIFNYIFLNFVSTWKFYSLFGSSTILHLIVTTIFWSAWWVSIISKTNWSLNSTVFYSFRKSKRFLITLITKAYGVVITFFHKLTI